MSDIRINRFNNPVTRAYLQSGNQFLRTFGLNGQQSTLSGISGTTSFNLGALYGGTNEFLPNIQVNNPNATATNSFFQLGQGFGQISTSSQAPSNIRPNGFNISLNNFGNSNTGRATITSATTPTTIPTIPELYRDWFAVNGNISEANLTALLNDPANKTFTIAQLGITVTSDGAGNIVNTAYTPTALQRVGTASELVNTQTFDLRNPLDFTTPGQTLNSSDTLKQARQPEPNPFALTQLQQLNASQLSKTRQTGTEQQLQPVNFPNGETSSLERLQQQLQQALRQRAVAAPSNQLSVTGPNAQLKAEDAQSLAYQRGQRGLQQQQINNETIRQLLAAKHHAERTTRPASERTGIAPLVSPDAPLNQAPQSATSQGLNLQLDLDGAMNRHGSGGLSLQFGQTGGQHSGEETGSGGTSQGQTQRQQAEGTQRRKHPLSFMA